MLSISGNLILSKYVAESSTDCSMFRPHRPCQLCTRVFCMQFTKAYRTVLYAVDIKAYGAETSCNQ